MDIIYQVMIDNAKQEGILPVLERLICITAELAAAIPCLNCSNIMFQLAADLEACKMRAEHSAVSHKANDLTVV